MNNYIQIVVAGDVDAGKSTLIGRYLYESGSLKLGAMNDIAQACKDLNRNFEFAYLLDSFEEERTDELTIDTTQSFCKSKNGKNIVFIDVPGHEELIKNMLSGASYADMAILVIDINKSVKDQTKRHAFILKFLGILKIIVVINKLDSVSFSKAEFLKTKKQIFEVFKNLKIESNECIPVSAKTGDNLLSRSKDISWYKGNLLSTALNNIKIKRNKENFRFLIQDLLEIEGKKVAIGPVISGHVKKGDKIFILPSQKKSSIKKISYFDKNIDSLNAPLAVGIVLENMGGLKRGQILSDNRLPLITDTILGKIIFTADINLNTNLRFRCTVQQTKVKIDKINRVFDIAVLLPKKSLPKTNDLAKVILKTQGKVVVEKYKGYNDLGRFVLIDKKEKIVAVGTVS